MSPRLLGAFSWLAFSSAPAVAPAAAVAVAAGDCAAAGAPFAPFGCAASGAVSQRARFLALRASCPSAPSLLSAMLFGVCAGMRRAIECNQLSVSCIHPALHEHANTGLSARCQMLQNMTPKGTTPPINVDQRAPFEPCWRFPNRLHSIDRFKSEADRACRVTFGLCAL